MQCDDLTEVLAAVADGSAIDDLESRRHVERCLRCQADLVQYRKLLRTLHNLRTEVLEPAPGLLADILANLEAAGERHALRSMITGRRLAASSTGSPNCCSSARLDSAFASRCSASNGAGRNRSRAGSHSSISIPLRIPINALVRDRMTPSKP